MNSSIAMDSPLAGNARPEKALWYQEVLSLDPDSRIFLPYARLLAELGRECEAVDVLKAGLARHPEFLEARLFLIELLHTSGQEAAAGLEADPILDQLSQSPALWRIWSRRPGLRADQAAMMLFFAAAMQKGGISLADVFEAGMASLESGSAPACPAAPVVEQDRPLSPVPAPVVTAPAAPCEEQPVPAQSFVTPSTIVSFTLAPIVPPGACMMDSSP